MEINVIDNVYKVLLEIVKLATKENIDIAKKEVDVNILFDTLNSIILNNISNSNNIDTYELHLKSNSFKIKLIETLGMEYGLAKSK